MAWGLEAAPISDAGHTAGAAAGNTEWERHRAVRVVAANAVDAAGATDLIEMLGLTPVEGKQAEEAA